MKSLHGLRVRIFVKQANLWVGFRAILIAPEWLYLLRFAFIQFFLRALR